jgi:predicted Zn finger-like uncharacterized protein
MSSENRNGYRIKCPSCGATYWYALEKLDEYCSVECQNCAMHISIDSAPMEYTTASGDMPDDIIPSVKPFLTLATSEGVRVKCPHCGAKYIYKDEQKLADGHVQCQNCGVTIDAVGEDVVIYQAPSEQSKTENTLVIVMNALVVIIIVLILLLLPLIIAVPVAILIAALKFCSSTKTESQETGFYTESGQGPGLR